MKNIVYLIGNIDKGIYKIGTTTLGRKFNSRLKEIQTGSPYKVSVIFEFNSNHASKIEKVLHRTYELNKKKEFLGDDDLVGEWFYLSKNEVDNFLDECKKIENNLIFLINNTTFNNDKFLK